MADNQLDPYEEDFDNFDDEAEFDSPEGEPALGPVDKIKQLWATNPGFKIITIIIGGVALVGSAFALLDSTQKIDPSRITGAADVAGTPGGENTPEVRRIIGEANDDRTQQAANTGGSAILTPEGAGKKPEPAPAPDANLDPLAQWQAAEKQQQAQIAPPSQIAAPPQMQNVQQQQEQKNNELSQLSQAMQAQMQSLMTSWGPISPNVIAFTKPLSDNAGKPLNEQSTTNTSATSVQNISAQLPPKVLQPAGEIRYGALLTEANSDIDGTPILAEVQNGPLKKARLIGQFEVRQNYLVLRFTRAVYKGREYQTDILALDPTTTLGGMATETDQRYFTRVILPAAARFVQGLGDAIAQSGTTTTITDSAIVQSREKLDTDEAVMAGLGDAAQSVGNFMEQQGAQTRPLVRVESGTALGLFFVQSVTDQTPAPAAVQPTPVQTTPYATPVTTQTYPQYPQQPPATAMPTVTTTTSQTIQPTQGQTLLQGTQQ